MIRRRFKYFMPERNEFSTTGEETLLSVSEYYGVKPRSEAFDVDVTESRAASLVGYRKVHAGDFVMNYMLAWKGAYGVSDYDGIVSPAYAVFNINPRYVDRRYIHHRLRSEHMRSEFRARSKGIIESRLRLYPDSFLSMEIELPDLSVQKAIADFLDRETARIDQLIAKKRLFVELAEAEFESYITHAVTLGLDRKAELKPSGYDWAPNIPKTWGVTRLKLLCSNIVDCLHETPQHDVDGEYPSVRTADVKRGSILLDQAKRVSESEYRHRIQRLEPKEGDVLFTREGERFGLAATVPAGAKLCLGQRMMMFRTNRKVRPEFLMWSLNGMFAYNFLKQDTAGATSPHLNIFDIRNVPIFLPSIGEQIEICEELNARFAKKEGLVQLSNKTIAHLVERRSALITAAVTGQIDVVSSHSRGTTDSQLDQLESEMSSPAAVARAAS